MRCRQHRGNRSPTMIVLVTLPCDLMSHPAQRQMSFACISLDWEMFQCALTRRRVQTHTSPLCSSFLAVQANELRVKAKEQPLFAISCFCIRNGFVAEQLHDESNVHTSTV